MLIYLVHNLESINGHNIQEIYDLVPQDVLAKNWKSQITFIKEEIAKDPDKAALMFLRIAKHNTHMKSEFSIYRKIERDYNIELSVREHNLKNVLLNTLHTFFGDFNNKNVYVKVTDFFYKVKFDYSTMQVAFYHLIENSSKYTLSKSTVEIDAFDDDTWVNLKFTMTSAHVKPEEEKEVLKEGVSGENAKKMGASGDGIGLWRINQMVELNGGLFEPNFGPVSEKKMGLEFSENVFIIKLKKN
jgi:signal transduction histidine kinase